MSEERSSPEPNYRSRAEAREVIDAALERLGSDPEAMVRLWSLGFNERIRLRDINLSVGVYLDSAEEGELAWSFSSPPPDAGLVLSMDSAIANRLLQGRESIAIGIARGRMTVRGGPLAALAHIPAMRLISDHYRAVVEAGYPHLVLAA